MSNPHPHLGVALDRKFKGLWQFNTDEGRRLAGRRDRMMPFWDHWFPTDSLADRFARALSQRQAIDIKEYCESFEFFTRTRRDIRRPVVADMCCGHGLTGILFAIFERHVEQVDLIDRIQPPSFSRVLEAAKSVAPWVSKKVRFHEMPLSQYEPDGEVGLVGVHACGSRTDRCISLALAQRSPIAVMPCCHSPTGYGSRGRVFDESIGAALAIDVDRTYSLTEAGYDVRWKAIPRAVTPMNRIILGVPISQDTA
jgi:hypothetical protein